MSPDSVFSGYYYYCNCIDDYRYVFEIKGIENLVPGYVVNAINRSQRPNNFLERIKYSKLLDNPSSVFKVKLC